MGWLNKLKFRPKELNTKHIIQKGLNKSNAFSAYLPGHDMTATVIACYKKLDVKCIFRVSFF